MRIYYVAEVTSMVSVEFMNGNRQTYVDVTNFTYEDGELVLFRASVGAVHFDVLEIKSFSGMAIATQVEGPDSSPLRR